MGYTVVYGKWGVEAEGGGHLPPGAASEGGGKTVSSIYFVTNEHKSGNDREVAWARAHQGESWNFDKLEEFFCPQPRPSRQFITRLY